MLAEVDVPEFVIGATTATLADAPCGPVAPTSPCGTTKLRMALDVVPEFVTEAAVPAAPVVVVPTAIEAAVPVEPCGPTEPVAPCAPVGPCGPTEPVAP
jgi:hypothetical protein